jgi:hypothetical protein
MTMTMTRIAPGVEVRATYPANHLVRSQRAVDFKTERTRPAMVRRQVHHKFPTTGRSRAAPVGLRALHITCASDKCAPRGTVPGDGCWPPHSQNSMRALSGVALAAGRK